MKAVLPTAARTIVRGPILTLHQGLKGDPRQNSLLAALPSSEWDRWVAHLTPVEMPQGLVLYDFSRTLPHVYFPTTSIVSLMYTMDNGAPAQTAMVGNEGIVGVSLFMGGMSTIGSAVVQCAGEGFRLPSHIMLQEFNRAGPVMHLFLRYTQALITQVTQTAICNRHHPIEQQLCRFLLLLLDRTSGNELVLTQELIGRALGVRRESVTEAASRLQEAGDIRARRGRLTVLNRSSLEKRVCECYSTVKTEYARLLPPGIAK